MFAADHYAISVGNVEKSIAFYEKLEFCERHNIVVPDTFFIVNSIHNEADHLKQNPLTGRFEEKAMVYKLQNGVVHHIVAQLFQYKGEALDASVVS